MDCTQEENKAFKEQMGIKGFPSFRVRALFIYKSPEKYKDAIKFERCYEQLGTHLLESLMFPNVIVALQESSIWKLTTYLGTDIYAPSHN